MASEHSLPLEAIKIAMSQTKDGIKLTLVLHPHEDAAAMAELFGHPVGQRYMVALVPVTEENTPQPRRGKIEADRSVTSAVMLCKDIEFQKWLFDEGLALDVSEEEAANALCGYLSISSRSELRANERARKELEDIKYRFIDRGKVKN